MKLIRAIAFASFSLLALSAASAQDKFPSKPIKLVVGFPPGGGADVVARLVGTHLGEALGQPFVIENKGGASGFIAGSAVAQSAPDGYTLLLGHVNALAIAPPASSKPPYDALKDFTPIGYIGFAPNVLVVNPKVTPVKTLKELTDLARAKPGELTFASPGVGSANQIAGVMFMNATRINMTHVPYRGGSFAITSVMAGETQLTFGTSPSVLPQATAGKLRTLAVSTRERSPLVPDVPGMREAGLPDYNLEFWYGMFLPAGTPPAVSKAVYDAVRTAMEQPSVKAALAREGTEVSLSSSPADFSKFLVEDNKFWVNLVKSANVKVD